MAETRVVHVDIQGQRYAIRSALDPKYIADIAAFVDARMDLAGRELATIDAVRIAVIAAVNIADELFRLRQESPDGRVQARALEIERLVDAALDAEHPAETRRVANK